MPPTASLSRIKRFTQEGCIFVGNGILLKARLVKGVLPKEVVVMATCLFLQVLAGVVVIRRNSDAKRPYAI